MKTLFYIQTKIGNMKFGQTLYKEDISRFIDELNPNEEVILFGKLYDVSDPLDHVRKMDNYENIFHD